MKCEMHLPLASTPAQIAEAKRMIEDAGIVLESTGNNPMDKESLVRSKFEFNKQLGVKLMIIAPSMATLPLVEKCVKEYDIRVALHNHGPEDRNFPTPSSVLKALKGTDPRMGLCLDIGHTARAGEDFVKAIRDAGPRLLDIDTKDLGHAGGKWTESEVGEGALPLGPMFKLLQAQRWGWHRALGIRDQRRQPAAGHAPGIRIHARSAGGPAGLNRPPALIHPLSLPRAAPSQRAVR